MVTVTAAPRFRLVPDRVKTLGPELVAFAEKVGIPLDEHQRLILDAMMGVNAAGGWASPENCVVEPRQNGKSSCLIVRALWGLFEHGEEHVLYSGHMWGAMHEAFLFAADVVKSSDEPQERDVKIRYSASDLGFTLPETGARLRFVTRSRQASRGAAADCILFDEAGWLAEATHSALVPTLAARSGGGKAWIGYAGTAVDQSRHPDGLVLANIRRRGIGGEDPRLCYLEWSAMAETRKPGTLNQYLIVFRLLLDHASVEPNVARDPRVKLPKRVREEPSPPSAEHLTKILAAIPAKWRLLFITIEQGALRLGEAVHLKWGDVDRDGLRLRLPRSATKRDKARWVYLPEWLIEGIEQTCPFEDRTPERRVFQGITEATAYQAMARACQNAGVPHYSPHSLRHRRISVWHQSGVPARELAERAGHARPSMSLDVYSHVMPTDEIPAETFVPLLSVSPSRASP